MQPKLVDVGSTFGLLNVSRLVALMMSTGNCKARPLPSEMALKAQGKPTAKVAAADVNPRDADRVLPAKRRAGRRRAELAKELGRRLDREIRNVHAV